MPNDHQAYFLPSAVESEKLCAEMQNTCPKTTPASGCSKLFALCNLTEMASEDDATQEVLELDTVQISYDTQTYKLIDIDN